MRRHHYRRRTKEAPQIEVTTFMNLMVVLVPFLLITAVFSRITIVELDLPSTSSGAVSEPTFRPEVVVREAGLEITNGRQVIAAIPKVDGEYDFAQLSDYMVELKRQYPDVTAASVLLESQISYDYLIQVMDVVRSVAIEEPATGADGAELAAALDDEAEADDRPLRVALFTDISIGDAP